MKMPHTGKYKVPGIHRKKKKKKTHNHLKEKNIHPPRNLTLQQAIGNQEVQHMFIGGEILAKLLINQPGDMYEQEADRVAREIIDMGDKETCLKSGKTKIQKKAIPGGQGISSTTESINALKGSGQPLGSKIRDYFQPRFGVDLGNVRVHTDSNADRLARAIRARAFTLGNDIVFAKGEFQPGTNTGKKLIAHELTHVLQQSNKQITSDKTNTIQRQEDFRLLPLDQTVRDLKIQKTGNRTTIQYPNPDYAGVFTTVQTLTIDGPESPDGRYAYEIVTRSLGYQYGTIYRVNIIAAPGVSINFDDPSYTGGSRLVTNGLLMDIVRVQDPYIVPAQGTPLHLESYVQHEAYGLPHLGNLTPIIPTNDYVSVVTDKSSVIIHIPNIGITIGLDLPNLLANERYAYQIVEDPLGGVSEVRVVVTPGIRTTLRCPLGHQAFLRPLLYLYEVDDPDLVPYQGSPIDPGHFRSIGRNLVFDEVQRTTTFEMDMALAATDACIGMIPVAGDIIDIGEFIYASITGKDRWGRDVTSLDLLLMGIGALLPFVGGGLLRGGGDVAAEGIEQIAKNMDASPLRIQRVVDQLDVLDDVELRNLNRWNDIIKSGGTIPADEFSDFQRILTKLGSNSLLSSMDEMGGGLRAALMHLDDPIKALDNLRASKAVSEELLNSFSDIELVTLDIVRQGLPPGTFTPELVAMLTRDVVSEGGSVIRRNPLVAMYLARITPDDIRNLRLTQRASPDTVYNVLIGGRRTGDIQPGIYGLMGERIHDWETFSDIASQMGPSQRGSMFEHWARQHILNVDFKNMERISIGENLYRQYGLSQPRVSDLFIDAEGTAWEFKYKPGGEVPVQQANDYSLLIGQSHPAKNGVQIEAVNYIFSTQQAAQDNLALLRGLDIGVYYVDLDGTLKSLSTP
jgi:hypothetical protein